MIVQKENFCKKFYKWMEMYNYVILGPKTSFLYLLFYQIINNHEMSPSKI